ncbi:MAG: bifunctional diaminohydroxyphosphoribosylaminopyrimidine deaminase/5-amino-6-(5-phosphoribosylamino)uracil reductase RibD [Sediminibacterium sp.]
MDEIYMQRCLALARLGMGAVAPNPMVGALLVHEDKVIGEGWHQQYGKAHAEVNCISSVKPEEAHLVAASTLYVSLEPCAHYGKTPPCSDLIIEKRIPKVVIGCRDPFKEVDGKGMEKLKKAGVTVVTGVLENECKALNKRFFTFHTANRPYVLLKWAQTANRFIASSSTERLLISNEYTNRLVHQWRSEEAAILVGTNTALLDDPSLDNRLWSGRSPVRMVIDRQLKLPASLKIFNHRQPTIIFNHVKQQIQGNTSFYKLQEDENIISQLMKTCYQLKLQSILVEGGLRLVQSFIDAGVWDEARIITNRQLTVNNGLQAPVLADATMTGEEKVFSDTITYYTHNPTN